MPYGGPGSRTPALGKGKPREIYKQARLCLTSIMLRQHPTHLQIFTRNKGCRYVVLSQIVEPHTLRYCKPNYKKQANANRFNTVFCSIWATSRHRKLTLQFAVVERILLAPVCCLQSVSPCESVTRAKGLSTNKLIIWTS